MGIRIKKVLGYGLSDIQTKDYKIVDDRFVEGAEEKIYEADINGFLEWLVENEEEATEIIETILPKRKLTHRLDLTLLYALNDYKKGDKRKWASYPFYDCEYGDPTVMVVAPIECPDWVRYDNVMDYYEAGAEQEISVNWLDRFCGIYPFVGAIRRPDAEKIGDLDDLLSPFDWATLRGTFSENPPIMGQEVADQVNERYRIIIPDSVALYTHWLGIWKDWKETVQTMRPVLYTYWS